MCSILLNRHVLCIVQECRIEARPSYYVFCMSVWNKLMMTLAFHLTCVLYHHDKKTPRVRSTERRQCQESVVGIFSSASRANALRACASRSRSLLISSRLRKIPCAWTESVDASRPSRFTTTSPMCVPFRIGTILLSFDRGVVTRSFSEDSSTRDFFLSS